MIGIINTKKNLINMIFKKFNYENGMNLLVPAKCGTRYISQTKPKNVIEHINHGILSQFENLVDNKTKMIFRNPRELLVSGLHTEFVWYGYTIDDLIIKFWKNELKHCSFNFWEYVYELWDINPFELIPLSDLSNLFDNVYVYNKKDYDSHDIKGYITKNELLDKIEFDVMEKIYDAVDIDFLWVKRMMNNERGLISQRKYNNMVLEKEKELLEYKKELLKKEKQLLKKEEILVNTKLHLNKIIGKNKSLI